MRKNINIWLFGLLLIALIPSKLFSQVSILDSLTTPDPDIRKYFPRWKVCENDIRIQIHQAFVILGVDKSQLDMSKVEVLAAPRPDNESPYELLTITCGKATMNANMIAESIPTLAEYIEGRVSFLTGEELMMPKRDYCYVEIPPEAPMDQTQAKAILSYMEPTNVDHSVTISLFEQSLKVGSSDFWLKNIVGSDNIGYPYWTGGEAKLLLKRPLYINSDEKSKERIPNLITAYMGFGYRIESGLESSETNALSWIPRRRLNSSNDGKLVAGFDFHMPFMPELGLAVNVETPLEKTRTRDIDRTLYATYPMEMFPDVIHPFSENDNLAVIPLLRGNGQISIFYNWWLNKEQGENFFRFDLGLSYYEIREMMSFFNREKLTFTMTQNGVEGLRLYKPNSFMDWVYAKVEYRNQAVFPFGMSVQLSNNIMLGKLYVPLIKWLYVEGKVGINLRDNHYFEGQTFFMISPVIRITL